MLIQYTDIADEEYVDTVYRQQMKNMLTQYTDEADEEYVDTVYRRSR